MFGYVKPITGELLVREYEFYKATYCGVCRAMKKYTGALSGVSLSYDSVLLALTRMLLVDKDDIRAEKHRCAAHPIKSRGMLADNSALEYTARAFALFTYYKLKDDEADGGIGRRTMVALAKPISRGAKRRAGISALSDMMKEKLSAITACENELCDSVDIPAAIFGELLGEVFAYGITGGDRTVYYTFGYHLGKFIYAADAAEDYDEDIKRGSYNPYALSWGKEGLTDDMRSAIKCALLLECRNIEGAMNLLPFGNRQTIENIVNNIVYLGLPKRIEFLDGSAVEKEITK